MPRKATGPQCVRCGALATERVNVCINEDRYPVDVCAAHARALMMDLRMWVIGLDPITHNLMPKTSEAISGPATLPPALPPDPQKSSRAVIPFPVLVRDEVITSNGQVPLWDTDDLIDVPEGVELPESALGWKLTRYAKAQIDKRDLPLFDVLLTAVSPLRVQSGQTDVDLVCSREGLVVVVEPARKVIITAYRTPVKEGIS